MMQKSIMAAFTSNTTDSLTTTIGGRSGLTNGEIIAIASVCVVAVGVFVAVLTFLGYQRKAGTGTFLGCCRRLDTEEQKQHQEEVKPIIPTPPRPTEVNVNNMRFPSDQNILELGGRLGDEDWMGLGELLGVPSDTLTDINNKIPCANKATEMLNYWRQRFNGSNKQAKKCLCKMIDNMTLPHLSKLVEDWYTQFETEKAMRARDTRGKKPVGPAKETPDIK